MDKFIVVKRKATSQDVPEELNWKDEIQYDSEIKSTLFVGYRTFI
jgi:hypothetical protein